MQLLRNTVVCAAVLDTYKYSVETTRWTRGGACVVDCGVNHCWTASSGCIEHHFLEGISCLQQQRAMCPIKSHLGQRAVHAHHVNLHLC